MQLGNKGGEEALIVDKNGGDDCMKIINGEHDCKEIAAVLAAGIIRMKQKGKLKNGRK